MSFNFLAAVLPAPQVPSGALWLAENAISTGSYTIPNSNPIPQGTTSDLPAFLSENAAQVDIGARHGGGAYGVAYGLLCSTVSGLTVNVSAGQAMIDGVVELYAAGSVVVGTSTTSYIWFKRNGTLEVRTATTAPAIPGVLLAVVVSGVSAITSIDFSGVVYLRSGVPERDTGDAGKPADTPPATWRGWTRTVGGLWWWDGALYHRLVTDLPYIKDVLSDGETVVIPENHQLAVFDSFTVEDGASLTISGKFKVIT